MKLFSVSIMKQLPKSFLNRSPFLDVFELEIPGKYNLPTTQTAAELT